MLRRVPVNRFLVQGQRLRVVAHAAQDGGQHSRGQNVRLGERRRRAGAVSLGEAADGQVLTILAVLQQTAPDEQTDVFKRSALLDGLCLFGGFDGRGNSCLVVHVLRVQGEQHDANRIGIVGRILQSLEDGVAGL